MNLPYLIGETIYLRILERDDVPRIVPWINHPRILRTLRIYRPINFQAEEAFLEQMAKSEKDVHLGIVLKSTDLLIGMTGLHQIEFKDRHASFGIVIGEQSEWDKGHGTETTRLMVGYAFQTLNLNRVWLHVYANNPRGIRAYEKVGFKREGILRQEHFAEGRYWDTIVMGILREEWAAFGS